MGNRLGCLGGEWHDLTDTRRQALAVVQVGPRNH